MKKYVLFSFGIFIVIGLLWACVQMIIKHHRIEFCNDMIFFYGKDPSLVIHPFYSNSLKRYVTVFPPSWNRKQVMLSYKGISSQTRWENDYVITEGGDILCLWTTQSCMFINTLSGTMDAIDGSEDKSVKETGRMAILEENGDWDYKGKFKSIHGRGNGTWRQHIKKPYNLNVGKNLSLLGMQKGKKYCLLSNNMERTNAKNFIAYRFAKELGMPYSVDERYVSLYLNGHYNGLYLMTNDISVVCDTENKRSNHTYLLQHEGYYENHVIRKKDRVYTNHKEVLRIKYPRKVYNNDRIHIQQCYDRFIHSLLDKDATSTAFNKIIDVESFAKYYLLQELLLNYDGMGNFYMSIDDKDSKIKAVTIWDFDQSMGMQQESLNVIENNINMYGFKLGRWCLNDSYSGEMALLLQKEVFMDSIRSIFTKALIPICKRFFMEDWRNIKATLNHENSLDDARWTSNINGTELDRIHDYVLQRLSFLQKEMWMHKDDEYSVKAVIYLPRKGLNKIYEFPIKKDSIFEPPISHLFTFRGWRNVQGEDISLSFRVDRDTIIYADFYNLPKWLKIDRSTIKLLKDRLN